MPDSGHPGGGSGALPEEEGIMKLDESLQQLFRQYGHGILLEESIVTKLTGLKSFDSSPALREAVKFLSDGGYLRELLARSRRNDPADFALYTDYLRKFLLSGGKFGEATVSEAVGSLVSALGHRDTPPLPASPAPDSAVSGGGSAPDSVNAPAADDAASPHDDILREGSPSEPPAACSAEYPTEECLRAAAEGGDAKAQVRLDSMYYHGQGAAQDLREAARWYRKAADLGSAEAQYRLAGMYYTGQGVKLDNDMALE